jgi:hypothetical protein
MMGRFWKELFGDREERSGAKAERLETRANAMALLRQKPIAGTGVSPAVSAPAGKGECVLPAEPHLIKKGVPWTLCPALPV